MGIQEHHDENTPTDPDSTIPRVGGAGSPPGSPGQPLPSYSSPGRLLLKVLHVSGATAITAWNVPWAREQYNAGDWKPMAAVALALVLLITRANIVDAAKAVGQLLPWGKGGKS